MMSAWIKTSEEMPPMDEDVLVFEAHTLHDIRVAYYSDYCQWREVGTGRSIHPSHWQPRPAPPEETMTHGIMGRTGKGPHGWTSRDYNIEVPCRRTTCPANTRHKIPGSLLPAICMMPSAIKINAAGVCQTGQDLIDDEKPQAPRKPDGD